jgi:hypothetical protein
MKTKIKAITIVSQQGIKSYKLNQNVNGLIIDRIDDESIEYEDNLITTYRGYTKSDELVFETVNAPTDCEYQPDDSEVIPLPVKL